ncbi:tetratricopeptide repeat protein [Aureimonas sp. ME7]|uniref:tetratricopeptide repeat protein n=1 Tax=Aureimonas sp. ME7 TaxID=2744252 RepID=UPI0015F6E1A7|nr:tetratricopeptide repeat protein [Aureimonas sp. ME7]
MSNDTFVREVNEELRQERVRTLWVRYGTIAIAAAVLIVLGVAGYVLWQRHQAGVAAADGDRLLAANALLTEGKTDEGRAALEALAGNGVNAYPALARMRLAEQQGASDPKAAIAAFDEVAAASGTPQSLRDMAAVRAAYLLVDAGTQDEVRSRVERLTGDAEPLRFPAREALGLSAWKAGDRDTANTLFTQLQEDLGAPAGIRRRASLMLELIAASAPAATTVAPQAPTEAPAPASAAPAPTPEPPTPATDPAAAPAAPAPSQPPA